MGAPEERTSSGWWLLGPRRASGRGGGGPSGALFPSAPRLAPGEPRDPRKSWTQSPGERAALGGSGFFPIRGCSPASDPGLLGAGGSTGRGRPAQTWACPPRPPSRGAAGDTPPAHSGRGGPCPGGLNLCFPARPPLAGRWAAGTRPLHHIQAQVPPTEHEWPPAPAPPLSSPDTQMGPGGPWSALSMFVLGRGSQVFFPLFCF